MRYQSLQRVSLLLLPCVLLVACTKRPEAGSGEGHPASPDSEAARHEISPAVLSDPHRLRNSGKLHAERDTKQGYIDASAHLRLLVGMEPRNANDRLNLAKTLLFAGDSDGSAAQLEMARILFGTDAPPDLDYIAALCSKRQRRFDEALVCIAVVLEARPENLHAWFQRGYLEEQLELLEDAESSYRRALELSPEHRSSLYRLAMVLRSLQRMDESKEILERLSARPRQSAEDSEKCDLTAITLRPLPRARSEPPEVAFSFRDITEKVLTPELADGVSRVVPLWRGGKADSSVSVQWGSTVLLEDDGTWSIELLLVGVAGARIVRFEEGHPALLVETLSVEKPQDVRDAVAPDLDNDGRAEVLVSSATEGLLLYRQDEEGLFREAPTVVSLPGEGEPMELFALDMDHDGDLDIPLMVKTGDSYRALLLRNNGDGSFTRLEPFNSLESSSGQPVAFTAHDVDQANDIDLVVAGGASGVQAFLNKRDGTFDRVALPQLGVRTRILVEDLTGDGAPDLFATGGDPGWSFVANADPLGAPRRLRVAEPKVVSSPRCGRIQDACLGDIDNDGDLDVLLASEGGVTPLRNFQGGSLREEETVTLPGNAGAGRIHVADLTGDGLLEVLATTSSGRLMVFSSGATPAYASWSVDLQGARDNRSALGTVVEQYCGRLYQSVMLREAGPLHLGLGREDRGKIDGLRLRWPQGIIQSIPSFEIEPDTRGRARFTQAESVVSSCPFLYVKGPTGWVYSTDILGIAPLDEWLPDGQMPSLDPEEIVRLPEELTAGDGCRLQVAVTEELRETAYLDRLQVLAVDHPEKLAVFVDESTRGGDQELPKLAVVSRAGLCPPASLTLTDGTDATDVVRDRDGRYARGYGEVPSQWGGWVPRYGLDLTTRGPARCMLLTGRIAWYDSTVTYALSQHGRTWGPLRLERLSPGGNTATLVEDLGLPAGMDRTMVVGLPGDPLEAGSCLRLSGHHRFLWDRILLVGDVTWLELTPREGRGELKQGGEVHWRTREVARADLDFHGFSKRSGDRHRHEQTYLYDQAEAWDAFPPAVGFATRYGDVASLLEEHDDLLVVLVPGDGVEVEFDALPPLEAGHRRTLFLRVSGWAKEGSFHNSTGGSIEPLPFRGMSRYPPPIKEQRRDKAYHAYLEQYQRREIRRRAP